MLVFRCLWLSALVAAQCFSSVVTEAVTLETLEHFPLRAKLPPEYQTNTVTHAIRGHVDGVSVLISPAGRLDPPQAVLRLNLAGQSKRFLRLDTRVDPLWLHVSSSGLPCVLPLARRNTAVTVSCYSEAQESWSDVSQPVPQIRTAVLLKDQLFAVDRSYNLLKVQAGGASPVTKVREVFTREHPAALDDHRTVILDERDASFDIVDTTDKSTRSFTRQDSPLLAKWVRSSSPDQLAVSSMAVVGQQIYLNLTGFPLSEGAVVYQRLADGSERLLRCPLPAVGDLAGQGDTGEQMFPSRIAVSGSKLFVIDTRGYLATCQLP